MSRQLLDLCQLLFDCSLFIDKCVPRESQQRLLKTQFADISGGPLGGQVGSATGAHNELNVHQVLMRHDRSGEFARLRLQLARKFAEVVERSSLRVNCGSQFGGLSLELQYFGLQLRGARDAAGYRRNVLGIRFDLFQFVGNLPKLVFDSGAAFERRVVKEVLKETLPRLQLSQLTVNIAKTVLELRCLQVVEAICNVEDILSLDVLEGVPVAEYREPKFVLRQITVQEVVVYADRRRIRLRPSRGGGHVESRKAELLEQPIHVGIAIW